MGSCHSTDSTLFQSYFENRSNINCPVCQKTGKLPTLSGRFHIINSSECKCNVCNTIFDKRVIYKSVLDINAENTYRINDNNNNNNTNVNNFNDESKYIKSD